MPPVDRATSLCEHSSTARWRSAALDEVAVGGVQIGGTLIDLCLIHTARRASGESLAPLLLSILVGHDTASRPRGGEGIDDLIASLTRIRIATARGADDDRNPAPRKSFAHGQCVFVCVAHPNARLMLAGFPSTEPAMSAAVTSLQLDWQSSTVVGPFGLS